MACATGAAAEDEETALETFARDIGGQLRLFIFDDDRDEREQSQKSVEADLEDSNTIKPAIFTFDPIESKLTRFYDFKEFLKESIGFRFTTDYTALLQRASSTLGGDKDAGSQVFRLLGTWLSVGDRSGASGNLVWKIETRTRVGSRPTPRELGFDTGSALSTANYKVQDFGATDLYWAQRLAGGKYAFLAGHMDPGDWADQYPLLNAWTSFMNDAFYNNPTQAIPGRGFALVGQAYIVDTVYAMAGVADANGKGSDIDVPSFFDTQEWFSWFEVGYRGSRNLMSRRNSHINIWHQDARKEAGVDESWGAVFTHSLTTSRGYVAFLRAGYSEGGAAQMRRFIGIGGSGKILGRDTLGCAVSWGSPPDKSLRDQYTSECFYRLQVTQNLTISPDIQATYKPSFNPAKDWVAVVGLRLRIAF